MRRDLVRRIAAMPFLLLAIVTIAFIISRLVPANPLATVLSQRELNNKSAVAAA
jgi:ABC-type dipeptide/oligopeptide/nickel transport system permease component